MVSLKQQRFQKTSFARNRAASPYWLQPTRTPATVQDPMNFPAASLQVSFHEPQNSSAVCPVGREFKIECSIPPKETSVAVMASTGRWLPRSVVYQRADVSRLHDQSAFLSLIYLVDDNALDGYLFGPSLIVPVSTWSQLRGHSSYRYACLFSTSSPPAAPPS